MKIKYPIWTKKKKKKKEVLDQPKEPLKPQNDEDRASGK